MTRSSARAVAGSSASSAAVRIATRIAVPNSDGRSTLRCQTCSITAPVPTTGGEPVPREEGRRGGSRLSWLGLAVSLLAVAGVVWWAVHQPKPELPSTRSEILALIGAIALYALATVVRSERWQRLLEDEGAVPARV